MNKALSKAGSEAVAASKKFTSVSVSRGKTAFPKTSKDLLNIGVRWDYDGEITENGVTYNRFQVQPNAGKIPSSLGDWRDKNGGTHSVMGVMLVKKGGDKEDVKSGFEKFHDNFKSS